MGRKESRLRKEISPVRKPAVYYTKPKYRSQYCIKIINLGIGFEIIDPINGPLHTQENKKCPLKGSYVDNLHSTYISSVISSQLILLNEGF